MSMPAIHSCLQFSVENERIKAKNKKLLKRNAKLEEQLKTFMVEFGRDRLQDRQEASTRSIQIQTDQRPQRVVRTQSAVPLQKPNNRFIQANEEQNIKADKMLTMHTNLMKRYQKELKTNTEQVEQIATLTLEVVELKKKLEDAKKKIEELQKEKEAILLRTKATRTRDRVTPSRQDLLADMAKITRERDKLLKEKNNYKDELKLLDRGFFEEVEDLKFALQQSAKLNTAYEVALRKLCTQFGVPVPSLVGSGKKRHKHRERQREFR
ncbi:centrosomal protein of 290 kDa [Nematostella vectensis]|uniref:centrosomal protein of 290 kDa n=1 Tax=Nematostella vectensis TaxID=45351 RepID=UPI0013902A62|nr:centrosomal protein of 290 kDa [Nematostella vectensis]